MKVFIGADHRGIEFKDKIIHILKSLGYEPVDLGAYPDTKSCDYPKVAYQVATRVAKGRNARGILLCMSGVGQAMAANKVKGAYAALCHNTAVAKLSREHNNANILVMGARFVDPAEIRNMIKIWLTTPFEGGRHLRRVNQIKKIERGLSVK